MTRKPPPIHRQEDQRSHQAAPRTASGGSTIMENSGNSPASSRAPGAGGTKIPTSAPNRASAGGKSAAKTKPMTPMLARESPSQTKSRSERGRQRRRTAHTAKAKSTTRAGSSRTPESKFGGPP